MSEDPSSPFGRVHVPLLMKIESLYSESIILEPDDDEMRAMTDWVVNRGKDFHTNVESSRVPAWVPFDPKTVASELLGDGLPEEPASENRGWESVLEMVDRDMMRPGINFASPLNYGYIPGGGIGLSAVADYWAAVTNRYAAMFFACPGAVKCENMLVRFVAKEMGLHHPERAGGTLTSGGSLATVSALVCAREVHKVLTGGADGGTPSKNFVVYMTDQTHSCVRKGLNLIGCGHLHIRCVPRDERLRMIPRELERMVEEDAAAGLVPWVLALTAGTTNCGAIDPIEPCAAVAKRHGMWTHVDGAYGGLYIMCPEGRAALGGPHVLDLADSIVADPHKSLFLPFGTGMIIVRDGMLLKATHSFTAPYLSRFVDNDDEISSADVSSELSKHFRALRMYLPLRIFGVTAFRAAQSEKILLARYFRNVMSDDSRFVVFHEPELSITMFRMRGSVADGVEDLAESTRRSMGVMEHLTSKEQWIFLSATTIDELSWIRFAVGVFRTHRRHVDEAITVIKKTAGIVLGEGRDNAGASEVRAPQCDVFVDEETELQLCVPHHRNAKE